MRRSAGFTLVELAVALAAMAALCVIGWRGLDAMARAQAGAGARSAQVLALQAGLAQWSADLDSLAQLPQVTALEWDGRALRLTRRGMGGLGDSLYVVAWTQREGRWLRWQSQALATRGEVSSAWNRAGLWAQSPGEAERRGEVAIVPLQAWQLFYFRGDSWSHPLSSGESGAAAAPAGGGPAVLVPDGVRLVLDLPPGEAFAGRVVRDWVSPRLGGGKS